MTRIVNNHSDSPMPPRSATAGLYSGRGFAAGAPWANVHVAPEARDLIDHLLRTNPDTPAQVAYQFAGTHRPSNDARSGWVWVPSPFSIASSHGDNPCASGSAPCWTSTFPYGGGAP